MFHDADVEMEYGSGKEKMIDDGVVGDNIVVLCQSSTLHEFFWIMFVDMIIHMVKKHCTDDWGQEWFEKD